MMRPRRDPNDKDSPDIQINDIRSSQLLAGIAQWFTDSFLRTAHAFDFDEDGNVKRDADRKPIRLKGRETRNESNHEIDLCQIYGMDEAKTKMLRVDMSKNPDRRGELKSQMIGDEEYPEFLLKSEKFSKKNPSKLAIKKEFVGLHDERVLRSILLRAAHNTNGYETIFACGLEHGNATITNSALNIVFLREHNRVAREIARAEPDWDDDEVFEKTHNTMIVVFLNIVLNDYIGHITPLNLPLVFVENYADQQSWYRQNRIHIEFNILYRWHGLVPSDYSFLGEGKTNTDFRHNNQLIIDQGLGGLIDTLSREPAGAIKLGNTPNFLRFAKEDTVRIMRDSNLASYNDYRLKFDLPIARSFEDITDDQAIVAKLKELYGSVDNVEWYVGMWAEKHSRNGMMGDLQLNMVAYDAFTHILTNPLYSKQVYKPSTFSDYGWKMVKETRTLEQVARRVVKFKTNEVCSFAHVKN